MTAASAAASKEMVGAKQATTMTAAFVFLLAARTAAAQAPSVELKPPPASVTIGAPVELEGFARIPPGATLSFQPPEADTGPVAFLGASLGRAEPDGAMIRQPLRLKVAAFELGVVTVPALSWTAQAPSGAPVEIVSPPVRFESVSPPGVKGEEGDIRDIRGPLGLSWWPLALLAAALAAGGVWLWKCRRAVAAAGGGEAPVDRRLPHERALDELNALFQSEVPVKEFYIRLTDILRRYFEARFGVSATLLTTSELMRQLRKTELDRSILSRCREVFDHADLVKFARWIPVTQEIRKDWSEAENLVRRTIPPPPAPPEQPAQGAK